MRITTFIITTIAIFALSCSSAPLAAPPISTLDTKTQETLKLIEEGWKLLATLKDRTLKSHSDEYNKLIIRSQNILKEVESDFINRIAEIETKFLAESQEYVKDAANMITQESVKGIINGLGIRI